MWVEKRSKNNYKFVEQYKDPLTEKPKRVSITLGKNTAHTRKEAQAALEAKIREKLKHVIDGKIKEGVTLEELKEEWLPDYKLKVKAYTYYNGKSRAKNLVEGIGPDTIISKLTPKYLTNYLNDLIYKKKLKNGSVKHYKETLNIMLRYAVLHDYLKTNPMDSVEVNYRSDEQSDVEAKYLEPKELKKVLRYLYKANKVYGRFAEFLYLTGMRYGEAAALTWEDFNKHTKPWTVSVTGTIVRIPKEKATKQDSPKTHSSVRTIKIPKRAMEIVKEQHELIQDGFLFRTPESDYLPEPTINGWLRLAKTKFDIDKPVSCHIFRHTHISKLAELGVPMYIVQQRVGHSTEKTTREIYLHVTKEAEEKYTDKLDLL